MRSLKDEPFGGPFSGGNNFESSLKADMRKHMGGKPLPGDPNFGSSLRAEVNRGLGKSPPQNFNTSRGIPNPQLVSRPRDNIPKPKALVDLIMSDSEEEIETPVAVEPKPKAKYIPKNRKPQKPGTDAELNPIPWRDTNDRDMRRINSSKSPGYTQKGVTAKSVEKQVKARNIKPKNPKEPTYLGLAKLDSNNSTKNAKDAKGREQNNDFQE
jgi:hypothetical protein